MTRANALQTNKAPRRAARRAAAAALAALLCLQALPAQALTEGTPAEEGAAQVEEAQGDGAPASQEEAAGKDDSAAVLAVQDEPEAEGAVAAPLAGEPVTVSIRVPTSSVRTWTGSSGPVPNLTFTLAISTQPGVSGATVEVPYGFIPDSSKDPWTSFTMDEPIYSFSGLSVPDGSAVVERWEPKDDKLVIYLKDTVSASETVTLSFAFNGAYDGKVPAGQVVWQGLRAVVRDSGGGEISSSAATDIKTTAVDGVSIDYSPIVPLDKFLPGNTIRYQSNLTNDYRFQSCLDDSANNRAYIEVPESATLSNYLTDFFGTTPTTSAQDAAIPLGHVRYYRPITNDKDTFSNWEYGNNPDKCFASVGGTVTLTDQLSSGDEVTIKLGVIYTKVNGKELEKTAKMTYTKTEQAQWKLFATKFHSNGTGLNQTWVVQGQPKPNGEATTNNNDMYAVGYSSYSNPFTTKNIGVQPVRNVKIVLEQPSSGSAKVNFAALKLYCLKDTDAVRAYYKVGFVIKDAKTNLEREVDGGTVSAAPANVTLPALSDGEYIAKVVITPMGTDGLEASKGLLPPDNGLGVCYTARDWPGDRWPDGTPIPLDASSRVDMKYSMEYYDETPGATPAMKTLADITGYVYYAPAHATDASVVVSSDEAAVGVGPGDEVAYSVVGYNGRNAAGDWVNPEIGIAVPKVLELVDPDEPKDFVDVAGGTTSAGAVKVELLGSDADNNYYRLSVDGTAAKNGVNQSFRIPLGFVVADGTAPGSYPVPFATASLAPSSAAPSFAQLNRATNDLPDEQAAALGYDNAEPSSYSGFATGHSPLLVVSKGALRGDAAAWDPASGEWTESGLVVADNGEEVRVRAGIVNSGNTAAVNVRLYGVLPGAGDAYDSTGTLAFAGLSDPLPAGATAWYFTGDPSGLPSYGDAMLQDWDAVHLAALGFSTDAPADMASVTAAFIDFGPAEVAAGDSLDIVPVFAVPASGDQEAVVEFKYSALDQNTGGLLNGVAGVRVATLHAEVSFDENLPAFLAAGTEHASGVPGGLRVLLGADGTARAALPSDAPTLAGYTFARWEGAGGEPFMPGDEVELSASGEGEGGVVLRAVWEPVRVQVSFDANHSGAGAPVAAAGSFGSPLPQPPALVRPGYALLGWATTPGASEPDVDPAAPVASEGPLTLYAVWGALPASGDGSGSGSNGDGSGTGADGSASGTDGTGADGSGSASDSSGASSDGAQAVLGRRLPRTGDAAAPAAACALAGSALAAAALALARRRGRRA